jgi:hypothetical protein
VITPNHPHDPEACHDGESCKPCEIARLKADVKRAAATKRVTPADRARALQGLAARAKDLLQGGAAGLVTTLVLAAALTGCVAPAEAVRQARVEAVVAAGHARDEKLPVEARLIGADEERAWSAQYRALTGDPVPELEGLAPLPAWLAALENPEAVPADAVETEDARPVSCAHPLRLGTTCLVDGCDPRTCSIASETCMDCGEVLR